MIVMKPNQLGNITGMNGVEHDGTPTDAELGEMIDKRATCDVRREDVVLSAVVGVFGRVVWLVSLVCMYL